MGAAEILDIAKRRGFFWQSSAIHGAISGFYDYGHIGSMVKRRLPEGRIKIKWRDPYVSVLEGLLARGGAEFSDCILSAYRAGARFDGCVPGIAVGTTKRHAAAAFLCQRASTTGKLRVYGTAPHFV